MFLAMKRPVLLIAPVAHFVVLFYLVWTPATSINCFHSPMHLEELFCLEPDLNFLGNLLLLDPTDIIILFLLPNATVKSNYLTICALTVLMEMRQAFIPGRDPSIREFLLNTFGALSAPLVIELKVKKA